MVTSLFDTYHRSRALLGRQSKRVNFTADLPAHPDGAPVTHETISALETIRTDTIEHGAL